MIGEKAYVLIKDLERNRDSLAPYETEAVNEIAAEVKQLVSETKDDLRLEESHSEPSISHIPSVKIRHAAIKRNIRCILAYHHHRLNNLRAMRWQFGTTLPLDIKTNLSQSEQEWFTSYSTSLVQYMRMLGDEDGVNLTIGLHPPKSLYIEVRCMVDYGQFELNDGSVLLLKKNSRHYLPRTECEDLIRQGVFEHVIF